MTQGFTADAVKVHELGAVLGPPAPISMISWTSFR
jgi:hypothetical protein